MRMIVDLSNLNNSITVHTTGESGHADHKHYDDLTPLWAGGQAYPMWWDQVSIIKDAEAHLHLVPYEVHDTVTRAVTVSFLPGWRRFPLRSIRGNWQSGR